MTRPPPCTVLLTGSSGFIGFRILLELLERGYAVRAVVRSNDKGKWLLSRLNAVRGREDLQDNVKTVVVDDFVREGAFDAALSSISHVIHVAAPIASSDNSEDWEIDFKQAVVQSTLSLLECARRSRSVRRIVLTSSIAAIFPTSVFESGSDTMLHAEMRIAETQPPYRHQMLAYSAGKIASLHAAEAWIAAEKPSFDIVHLYPAFTIGRNEAVETKWDLLKFSSNWHCLQIILGHSCPRAKPLLTCHIDDVARCHVEALDPKVRGNQGFVIASHQPDLEWDTAKAFVQTRFKEAVQTGVLPNNGHMPTSKVSIDIRKTEETFGFSHIPYESQVYDLVEQYLELHGLDEAEQRE
ncbi:hypothetical protein LTR37_008371 [Vermiconidia calcicola]|uniref:Uncharacterized protein n=1 Tax=Vermiconidia calcicola TaxID=1690605 RepID=A0ACC3NAW9_9PEZI|nr:hypothetical protein LTR37_008371 [Vermiconidia calcicola]